MQNFTWSIVYLLREGPKEKPSVRWGEPKLIEEVEMSDEGDLGAEPPTQDWRVAATSSSSSLYSSMQDFFFLYQINFFILIVFGITDEPSTWGRTFSAATF